MKEFNLHEAVDIKVKLKIFLFINGDVSILIHAKTLLETSEWLEKKHYIRSDAFTSGSLIMELTEEQYQNKVQVESELRTKGGEISNRKSFILNDKFNADLEKESKLLYVCLTELTGFEVLVIREIVIRKTIIFTDGNMSILIWADSFSDAARWLESKGYSEKNQTFDNTMCFSKRLLFQLEDDPLDWYFLVNGNLDDCPKGYGEAPNQGLGEGIVREYWEQANQKIKKLITD